MAAPVSGLEQFLSDHGLVALLIIATVEGDLSLLVGGVLAHAGILPLLGVIVAGALGNLVGDSVWYAIGRWGSERIRGSRPYRVVGPRIERLVARFGPWQLLAARVVYGTRNMSMLLWGHLRLAPVRFLLIDGLGCVLAATAFALLGSGVGESAEALTGTVKRVEHWLLVAVVVGAALVWGINRLARRELGD